MMHYVTTIPLLSTTPDVSCTSVGHWYPMMISLPPLALWNLVCSSTEYSVSLYLSTIGGLCMTSSQDNCAHSSM